MDVSDPSCHHGATFVFFAWSARWYNQHGQRRLGNSADLLCDVGRRAQAAVVMLRAGRSKLRSSVMRSAISSKTYREDTQ
jgi:hypothetical protein